MLVLDRARGAFVPVQWQNVRVGDVLKIMKHEVRRVARVVSRRVASPRVTLGARQSRATASC